MGFFDSMDASASGMTAERFKMDLIANNIANVNTTRTLSGEPYRRHVALITPKVDFEQFFVPAALGVEGENPTNIGSGVQVSGVMEDPSPPKMVYDPSHPDANEKGYVAMPNVDLISEMTGMMQASRAYEANATAIESAKAMISKAFEIGKG